MSRPDASSPGRRPRRIITFSLLAFVLATLLWWGWGRLSAHGRRLVVVRTEGVERPGSPRPDTIRVLAWNIAHGRGDREQGAFANWKGGTPGQRIARLEQIAAAIARADADVVVLNEVDFDAGWSDGINQAAFLAEAAGYPYRVEQRNFDVRVPLESWSFGNALLTRLEVESAVWVELPDHSFLENVLVGSKEAALVRLSAGSGPVGVVPIHLDFRPGDARLRAIPVLEAVRASEPAPIVLAGDFNSAPPGWPWAGESTAVGALLEMGWRSVRAERPPGPAQLTYPTRGPQTSRDWIFAEPRLDIVEAHVVRGVEALSDHAPVLAVIRLSGPERDGPHPEP